MTPNHLEGNLRIKSWPVQKLDITLEVFSKGYEKGLYDHYLHTKNKCGFLELLLFKVIKHYDSISK
jgi:hypothetical protein